MKHYVKRIIRLIFGLFLYALGSFLTIQANIGLDTARYGTGRTVWKHFFYFIRYRQTHNVTSIIVMSVILHVFVYNVLIVL